MRTNCQGLNVRSLFLRCSPLRRLTSVLARPALGFSGDWGRRDICESGNASRSGIPIYFLCPHGLLTVLLVSRLHRCPSPYLLTVSLTGLSTQECVYEHPRANNPASRAYYMTTATLPISLNSAPRASIRERYGRVDLGGDRGRVPSPGWGPRARVRGGSRWDISYESAAQLSYPRARAPLQHRLGYRAFT